MRRETADRWLAVPIKGALVEFESFPHALLKPFLFARAPGLIINWSIKAFY